MLGYADIRYTNIQYISILHDLWNQAQNSRFFYTVFTCFGIISPYFFSNKEIHLYVCCGHAYFPPAAVRLKRPFLCLCHTKKAGYSSSYPALSLIFCFSYFSCLSCCLSSTQISSAPAPYKARFLPRYSAMYSFSIYAAPQ